MDGTGTAWDHIDGWAYRNEGSEASSIFDISEWFFSGPNALDGETVNELAQVPFPIGAKHNVSCAMYDNN